MFGEILTAKLDLVEAAKASRSLRSAVFKPEGGGEEYRDFSRPTSVGYFPPFDSAISRRLILFSSVEDI